VEALGCKLPDLPDPTLSSARDHAASRAADWPPIRADGLNATAYHPPDGFVIESHRARLQLRQWGESEMVTLSPPVTIAG